MPKDERGAKNQDLQQTLVQIDKKLKKLNSFKRNFAVAVVRGLGFTLGGTILLGIIIALLMRITSVFLQNSQFLQQMPWQQQIQQDFQQQINGNPFYEN